MNAFMIRDALARAGAPGETLEWITDFITDAEDGNLSAGAMATLGKEMEQLGKDLTATAKKQIEPNILGGVGNSAERVDDGVLLKWVNPKPATRINTARVKEEYPKDEYPELYTQSQSKDYITIKVLPK